MHVYVYVCVYTRNALDDRIKCLLHRNVACMQSHQILILKTVIYSAIYVNPEGVEGRDLRFG